MKIVLTLFLIMCWLLNCCGQLATKRDYNAAFALQAGGDVAVLMPFADPVPGITPAFGLKMTFPFTRKWFMGGEVNYSGLRAGHTYKGVDYSGAGGAAGDMEADFNLKRIQIPVYLKYMLRSNKAGVLFGAYASWLFDRHVELNPVSAEAAPLPVLAGTAERWEAGVTVGYEQRIVKHLNLQVRLSGGLMPLLKKNTAVNRSVSPLQLSLTLSYDILRIGDCGCD